MIKLESITRRWRTASLVAVLAVAVIGAVAAQPWESQTAADHDQTIADAEDNYDVGPLMPSITTDKLAIAPDPSEPGVRAIEVYSAAMKAKDPARTETHHFVAAFLSTKNYHRLGLRKGMNYVYTIPQSGTKTPIAVLVPEEGSHVYVLRLTNIDLAHSNAPVPHAVRKNLPAAAGETRAALTALMGGCIEGCDLGHCGSTDYAFEVARFIKGIPMDRKGRRAAR